MTPESTSRDDAAAIHPQARIGHVHLKVADLERAIGFYRGILGFELTQRYGDQAAFLSAGGYHHHIGLNTWESLGGPPPPAGTTGLYPQASPHFLFRFTWRVLRQEGFTCVYRLRSRKTAGISE